MTTTTERPQTKPARKEAKEKERPELPEGRSAASIRMTDKWEAADVRHDASVWSGFCTTLTRGRDLLKAGYSLSDPIFCKEGTVQFLVNRPAKEAEKNGIEHYKVDVKTGDDGELEYTCDPRCGQGATTEICKHVEFVALQVEAYTRLLRHLGIVPATCVLPVAPIASQEAACECNGSGWVPNGFDIYGTVPCPTCRPWTTEPRRFYDEDDYRPPVSAETRRMDWED